MLSVMTVVSIPSLTSSHAVRRAPCRNGRVSSAKTATVLPDSMAPRMTPRAVPYPAVASAPALQWVRMRALSGTTLAPYPPMARQLATSSSWMAADSVTSRALSCPTDSPAVTPAANDCFIRSMAQNRFTAVGRVDAINSQSLKKSVASFCVPVDVLCFTPRARPIAAATPMAGAPRMTMVLIARATSAAVRQET